MNGTEFARITGSYNTAFIGSWKLVRQDTAGNYSVIRLYGTFRYGGGDEVNSDYSSFSLNGELIASGDYHYKPGDYQLGTTDITVYHNADGSFPSRTIYIKASSYHMSGETYGIIKGVASIPRKANILSAPNFKHTENPTMKFENPGGYPINAYLEYGNPAKSICLATNIPNTGSYTFNLTDANRNTLLSACPNAKSMSIKFVIATIIGGGTQATHWSALDRTMTVDEAKVTPTFTNFTYADINPDTVSVTKDNQVIVSGRSTLQVTISKANKAVARGGASMVKYILYYGNQSKEADYASDQDVNIILTGASSQYPVVVAQDSRGFKTTISKVTAFVPYTPPVIRSSRLLRANGVGEAVTLDLATQIYSGQIGQTTNAIQSITYRYRRTGTNAWITGSTAIPAGPNISQAIAGDIDAGFTMAQSYDVEITVRDALAAATILKQVTSGVPVLDMYRKEDQVGVSIGAFYDTQAGGLLQMAGVPLLSTGTSGIWTWRKWADGTAECWGTDVRTFAIETSSGGMYYSENMIVSLPITFTEIGCFNADVLDTWAMGKAVYADPVKGRVAYKAVRGTEYRETSVKTSLHVMGRWK